MAERLEIRPEIVRVLDLRPAVLRQTASRKHEPHTDDSMPAINR